MTLCHLICLLLPRRLIGLAVGNISVVKTHAAVEHQAVRAKFIQEVSRYAPPVGEEGSGWWKATLIDELTPG